MSIRSTCVSGVRFVLKYNKIYQDVNKMSGHHSRYRDNYKSQVRHTECQVIA